MVKQFSGKLCRLALEFQEQFEWQHERNAGPNVYRIHDFIGRLFFRVFWWTLMSCCAKLL